MQFHYDKEQDILTIELTRKPDNDNIFPFEAQDFIVEIDLDEDSDDEDEIISLTIKNAKQFVGQILSLGIEPIDPLLIPTSRKGTIWHDADSSMISAFGYDEAEQILDVAFHKTGTYRYYNVPKEVVEGLHTAGSQGSYMRTHIIDVYPYEKKRGR